MSRLSVRAGLVLVAAGFALAAGCTKQIRITQYPEFYTPDLKTVAVVPFRATVANRAAGDAVAEQFARSLAGTKTYQVYSRYDLKTILDEQDMQLALGDDPNKAAQGLAKSGKV